MLDTSLVLTINNFPKGGDFMAGLEQGVVTPTQAVVENGRSPITHPLRSDRIAPDVISDPVWRGSEELAMTTGRVEVLERTNLK